MHGGLCFPEKFGCANASVVQPTLPYRDADGLRVTTAAALNPQQHSQPASQPAVGVCVEASQPSIAAAAAAATPKTFVPIYHYTIYHTTVLIDTYHGEIRHTV